MKLDSITLNNFKVFEHKTFDFSPGFNVIIGENGVGKTSLLEAITVSLNPFLKVVTGKNMRGIKADDIRRMAYSGHTEERLFCSIEACGDMVQPFTAWKIVRERLNWGHMRTDTELVIKSTQQLVRKVVDGDAEVALPLVKYYGTVRFQRDVVGSIRDEFKGKSSRLDVYLQALNPFSSITQFTEWFKRLELASLQGKEESKQLALMVKKAVAKCVPGWKEMRYDLQEEVVQALMENTGEWVPIKLLSDGQKTVMGMVADLVYRCVILNPQLGSDAAKLTSGIVLIDEIDIHLHPNWQRKIVGMLKEVFPNIQFIATTHSPFIVQSLKNKELIDLQGKKMLDDYRKRGIEEIVEGEMGVKESNRSERFLEMKRVAKEYYELIAQGTKPENSANVEEIKAKLNELLVPFNDDPAYVTFLESFKYLLKINEAGR